MDIQKIDPDRLEMAASMLKAIAHPVRIAILKHLEGGKKSLPSGTTPLVKG